MEGLLDLNNLNYDTIFVVKNLRFLRLQIDFNSFGLTILRQLNILFNMHEVP